MLKPLLLGSLPLVFSSQSRICPLTFTAGDTGSVVQFDGAITLFGARTNQTCIVNQDESLKYKDCTTNSTANEWVMSASGKIMRKDSNRCFLVPDKTRKYQSVKVKDCDQVPNAAERQEFDIVNGRIHVRSNKALCLAVVKKELFDGSIEFEGTNLHDFEDDYRQGSATRWYPHPQVVPPGGTPNAKKRPI